MLREEAKTVLYEWQKSMVEHGVPLDTSKVQALRVAIEALSERTGEWIKATGMMPPEFHGHHCCSECGNFANMEPPFGNREDLGGFCPNCGARMLKGGEQDGNV